MRITVKTAALIFVLLLSLLLLSSAALAASTVRGILVREAVVYLSPDESSAHMATAARGREVAILETSRDWIHVLASITKERDVTGWMRDQGVVRANTPAGDQILFGEAVNSEQEASRRGGRKGADQDAFRLYRAMAEYFPASPLAAEAAYRAADVQWQLDRADMLSRPSAREREAFLRHQMNEDLMREVIKKYRGTRWADLAALHLLENQACGDWQGESKCPEREAALYEKFAAEHPQSPVAAEALYQAATRRAALIDIYRNERQPARSAESRTRALALIDRLLAQSAAGDWGPRARTLQFLIQQGVPTFGLRPAESVSEFKP